MIYDEMTRFERYADLNPHFRSVIAYLRATDLAGLAVGRYEIEGENAYALVQEYETKSADACKWEAHRKYVDIQYVVSGAERMGFTALSDLSETQAYDAGKDVALYAGDGSYVDVGAGHFAIFFPEDAHKPCMDAAPHAASGRAVKKVVIKVRVA